MHVHLLNLQLALLNLLVNELMAGIEAAHVTAHGNHAGFLRDLHQRFGILDAVGDGNFDQHMLAGAHHLLALTKVHLGRGGEDHCVGALDALREIAGMVRNAVLLGDFRRGVLIAADQRGHLDLRYALERIQMLLPERTLTGDANFHGLPLTLSVLRQVRHCERSEAIQPD